MNSIKEYIRKNPVIIANHASVTTAIEEVKKDLQNEFAKAITMVMIETHEIRMKSGMSEESFGRDLCAGLVITPKADYFTKSHPSIDVVVAIGRYCALIIGLEVSLGIKQISDEEELVMSKVLLLLKKEQADTGIHHSHIKEALLGTYWPAGYHDLINGFIGDDCKIAEMLNSTYFKSCVENTVTDILRYMELLERCYIEAKA